MRPFPSGRCHRGGPRRHRGGSEHWFGDKAVLVLAVYLAIAIVAFNWWELWRSRRER